MPSIDRYIFVIIMNEISDKMNYQNLILIASNKIITLVSNKKDVGRVGGISGCKSECVRVGTKMVSTSNIFPYQLQYKRIRDIFYDKYNIH